MREQGEWMRLLYDVGFRMISSNCFPNNEPLVKLFQLELGSEDQKPFNAKIAEFLGYKKEQVDKHGQPFVLYITRIFFMNFEPTYWMYFHESKK